ncbi:MAG TPA: hypothetical protein DIS94_00250 [Bacteroidetes bacterium]|nr:hypothetical protein [Bacteroidota bacterium]
MNVNIRKIAKNFSTGKFDNAESYLTENCSWEIFGEMKLDGKNKILEHCQNISGYFNSVETEFTTHNVISNDNSVSINGRAVFKKDNEIKAIVNSCDVYEFNNDFKIKKIYSYCIYENL